MAILKDQYVKTGSGVSPIDFTPDEVEVEALIPEKNFGHLDFIPANKKAVECNECITVILEDGETFRCTPDTKIIESIKNGVISYLDIESYNQKKRSYVLGVDPLTGEKTHYRVYSIERNGILFSDTFYKLNFVYKDLFVGVKFKNSDKTIFIK